MDRLSIFLIKAFCDLLDYGGLTTFFSDKENYRCENSDMMLLMFKSQSAINPANSAGNKPSVTNA